MEEESRKKKSQKVRFDEDEEADLGGAIRNPRKEDVSVDVRRIEMTEALQPEDQRYYDDDDTDTEDEEAAAYSHYGGRLSGKGMAHDPPDVASAVMKTFAGHPEILATYVQGRVPRPMKFEDRYGNSEPMHEYARRDAGATIVDYGGSIPAVTHSVNGYLTAHNHHFPHEFHII